MKLSPPSSLSSSSDPPLSSGLSDLQDRLTAATASISIGIDNDQGFIGLGQDPSLAISSGDGVTPPVMRVQSTDSLHDDKQLLGDPTGKSVDFTESPPRYTSIRKGNDTASFVNEITQGDVGTFSDTSTGFETAAILSRLSVILLLLLLHRSPFRIIFRVIAEILLLAGFRVLLFAIGVISNYPVVFSLLHPSNCLLPFLSQPLPIARCLFVFSAFNKRILWSLFAVVNLGK